MLETPRGELTAAEILPVLPQSGTTGMWLTVEDLAGRWDLPLGTVRKWSANGEAPRKVRFGKRVRFHIDDVIAWERARREASA